MFWRANKFFLSCISYQTIGEKLEIGKCCGSPLLLKQGTILILLKPPKHCPSNNTTNGAPFDFKSKWLTWCRTPSLNIVCTTRFVLLVTVHPGICFPAFVLAIAAANWELLPLPLGNTCKPMAEKDGCVLEPLDPTTSACKGIFRNAMRLKDHSVNAFCPGTPLGLTSVGTWRCIKVGSAASRSMMTDLLALLAVLCRILVSLCWVKPVWCFRFTDAGCKAVHH